MHERAVTESILEIATRHASQAGAKRITDIYLVIGDFSSIIDDSIQFYWDLISAGTLADGSCLHFKRIATQMNCLECSQQYSPSDMNFKCPNCGGSNIKIITGDEFYMESIGVE